MVLEELDAVEIAGSKDVSNEKNKAISKHAGHLARVGRLSSGSDWN